MPGISHLAVISLVNLSDCDTAMTVDQFVEVDGCWNWNELSGILPLDVCKLVASLYPPPSSLGSDSLA